MKHTVSDLLDVLEEIAPLSLQESYDNSGLIIGDKNDIISNVLLSLDCTLETIKEAIKKNCNIILSHHPLIFGGLKSITTQNTEVEKAVILAIKNNINIIACHTNLDNVYEHGVSTSMLEIMGLKDIEILVPKSGHLCKLKTYIPLESFEMVQNALFDAGAGRIGNYSECGFSSLGEGTFNPSEYANPVLGDKHCRNTLKEKELAVLVPNYLINTIVHTLKKVHPYEEIAYDVFPLLNKHQRIGSGAIGILNEAITQEEFLLLVKKSFECKTFRYSKNKENKIKKIAFCGGSGSFLIEDAMNKGADAYITSDIKYHDFFEASHKLTLCDIGHYESEIHTLKIFSNVLTKKFTTFATLFTDINTNPVAHYA